MTLNFPDSPSTGDTYTDTTSGFSYEWNGTVWISTDPQRAAHIKELDDISSGFNGSTTQFNLRVSSTAIEPVSDAQLLISVGGVMQNPTNDYTVSGSTITFTTAPSAGLTFFGVFLGQALSLNTVQDGTVSNSSFKAGTAGVGIQSGGTAIGVGITQINFIGAGNTFVAIGNTVDVSIASGADPGYYTKNSTGIHTLSNVGIGTTTATVALTVQGSASISGDLNVTGDLTYDEVTGTNLKIAGVTTSTGLNVLGITSTKDLKSVGVTTLTTGSATNFTATNLVGTSVTTTNFTATNLVGTSVTTTSLKAPVAFTTSLTAANVDVTGITTIRDDLTLKGASANITFDKSTDDLIFNDNAQAKFGTGGDLGIYHNGSHNYIESTNGNTILWGGGTQLKAIIDGAVEVYYDNTKRIETTSVGVNVVGNVDCDSLNNAGISTFRNDVEFAGASANITWDKSEDDLIFMDNAKAVFGTGSDMSIYHSGSDSYISQTGSGNIIIQGNGTNNIAIRAKSGEEGINLIPDGSVDIYYDNSKKLNTTSVGVNITGNVDCDSLNNAGITTLGSTVTTAGKITANVNGTALHCVSTSTESNILLQNDARTWKIVNYDYGTGADNLGFHDGSGDRLIISHTTGNATFGGAVTADSFSGDGSTLTGIGVTIAPLNYNPNPGATGVKYNSGIGATFNQAVIAGSGNVTLSIATNAGAAGTTVENFGVGSSVSISGAGVAVSPTNPLNVMETYRIDFPAGVLTNNVDDKDSVAMSWTFQVEPVSYKLWAWGSNEKGKLGQSNLTRHSSPVQIPGANWRSAYTGYDGLNMATKTDNTLWMWGDSNSGSAGETVPIGGISVNISSPIQMPGTTWAACSTGTNHSQASRTDGTLWAWGRNSFGALGLNQVNESANSSPAQIPGTNWPTGLRRKLDSGYRMSAAVKTNGQLWVWGFNDDGALGMNNRTRYSSPVQVPGNNWRSVALGVRATVATKTDGTLWAWGLNTYGQMGQNDQTERSSPKQIGSATDWSAEITCFANSAGAIKTNGELWMWGRNDASNGAALGQGNTNHYSSPVQLPGTTWKEIQGGQYEPGVNAIKTDGTLWGWGHNEYGRAGTEDNTDYSSPKQIGALTTWDSMCCGIGEHMRLAIEADTTP